MSDLPIYSQNTNFGRKRRTRTKRSSSPKRKTMKLTKKSLDSLSLKKLQKLAVKHKVSVHKKGTKKTKKNLIKKSTLLTRMKKSRSINKILLSAHKMKHNKRTKFGNPALPDLTSKSLGQTTKHQRAHYMSTPKSLLSYNFVAPVYPSSRSYGTSSLPVMTGKHNKFGQYFR